MRTWAAATVPYYAARTCEPALRPRCPVLRLGHADLRCGQNSETKFLYIFDTRGGGGVHKSLSRKIPDFAHFYSKRTRILKLEFSEFSNEEKTWVSEIRLQPHEQLTSEYCSKTRHCSV